MQSEALREGTAAWRSYSFRPRDPIWAPASVIARTRKRLAEFDWRLGLWFSPFRRAASDPETPGRWRLVEWLPRQGNWVTVLYLESPEGHYRPPDNADWILRRLGPAIKPLDELDEDLERENQANMQKQRREKLRSLLEHHMDLIERDQGIRQTFAPGYIRRRQVKRSDLDNTNHKRWLKSVGMA